MNKKIIIAVSFVCVSFILWKKSEKLQLQNTSEVSPKSSSSVKNSQAPLIFKPSDRSPAQASNSLKRPVIQIDHEPSYHGSRVSKKVWENALKLPKDLRVIPNVHAVMKEEFDDSMGKFLEERAGMTIFRAEFPPMNAANVAYDKANDKFYPIASVIKIRGVDEDLKNKLISEGLEEHHYNDALKILFVKSTHEKVIALYQELTEKKLDPQLEIIRGYHKPR